MKDKKGEWWSNGKNHPVYDLVFDALSSEGGNDGIWFQ